MDASPEVSPLAGASREVLDEVLQLNQAHVAELSTLHAGALDRMIGEAFHATAVGNGEGFLIAFDQDADYDSPNFRWFQARYARFVYVDRVVVAAASRGRGLAGRLYEDLFRAAALSGHSVVACEINIDPPNPASDAFHHAYGFEGVGSARLPNGKAVRYLTRKLDRPP